MYEFYIQLKCGVWYLSAKSEKLANITNWVKWMDRKVVKSYKITLPIIEFIP